MNTSKSTQSMTEAEIKFWEHYVKLLNQDGITGKKSSYIIHRAQEFAYSLDGKRLKSVEERDVAHWLGKLDRNGHLEGWQLIQAHKAVQFLLTRMPLFFFIGRCWMLIRGHGPQLHIFTNH